MFIFSFYFRNETHAKVPHGASNNALYKLSGGLGRTGEKKEEKGFALTTCTVIE